MRAFRLLELARQAELLRWRRMGRGLALQEAFGAAAAGFGLLAVLMLHLAAFIWLAPVLGPVPAALLLALADALLCGLLAWRASHPGPDRIALEARQVRDDALRAVGNEATSALALAPLLRNPAAREGIAKGIAGLGLAGLVLGLLSRRDP
jgi:hypothetical protein